MEQKCFGFAIFRDSFPKPCLIKEGSKVTLFAAGRKACGHISNDLVLRMLFSPSF